MTESRGGADTTPASEWSDALREIEEASRMNDQLHAEIAGLRDELNRLRSRRIVRWTDALSRLLRRAAGR